MRILYSKCGANCGHCPAYHENARTAEARRRCRDGWHGYLGFSTKPERCYCHGCQTPDANKPILVNPRCSIRKCATKNGIANCAYCSKYPCKELKASSYVDRKWAEARLGVPLSEEDYLAFIEPYEGLKHLDEIRASLGAEDIVEPKPPAVKPRIVGFPEDLPFSDQEIKAYEALHTILANIKSISGNTHIRQEALERRKRWILKLLWMAGLFGELREVGGPYIAVNSETFSAQKIPYWMDLRIVRENLRTLKGYGVRCEHVPLTKEKYGKKGWLTPAGHLRKTGWFMKMSFDDNVGGSAATLALTHYATKLDERYGKRAFRRFSNVDMRGLEEE